MFLKEPHLHSGHDICSLLKTILEVIYLNSIKYFNVSRYINKISYEELSKEQSSSVIILKELKLSKLNFEVTLFFFKLSFL